jgi:hypothetical protein
MRSFHARAEKAACDSEDKRAILPRKDAIGTARWKTAGTIAMREARAALSGTV